MSRAYSAPACAYLAFVCVFVSLLVLADTACLRQRVVLARAPCARMPCTCLRVTLLYLCVCFLCTWSTSSIAVTTKYIYMYIYMSAYAIVYFKTICECIRESVFIRPMSIAGVPFDSVRHFRATLLLYTTCMRL